MLVRVVTWLLSTMSPSPCFDLTDSRQTRPLVVCRSVRAERRVRVRKHANVATARVSGAIMAAAASTARRMSVAATEDKGLPRLRTHASSASSAAATQKDPLRTLLLRYYLLISQPSSLLGYTYHVVTYVVASPSPVVVVVVDARLTRCRLPGV
jgi:hypothetical protein